MPRTVSTSPGEHHETVIVGAGFSGLGAAIKLDEAGFGDFLILEQGSGVGGAWHFNTYPGVAVDIPSLSYSFSFERNPNWSRLFAPGDELKRYAEHCVSKYNLGGRIRYNTSVLACEFDESTHRWMIHTATGRVISARYLIGATGVLTQPKLPEIPGVGTFEGITMHTARWDHQVDLKGKRVAVIGTGASALQAIPEIAPDVAHLTVFQRTPIWVIPKPDTPIHALAQKALEKSNTLQWASRMLSQTAVEIGFVLTAHYHKYLKLAKVYEKIALDHLKKQVKDPETRQKLTPQYGFGCKRPSTSNTYLKTFNRENVSLVTSGITKVDAQGVYTQDGQHHPVDILICATGFKVFEHGNMPPFPMRGVGGKDLESWWDSNRYQAYEGVTVPGFPNAFLILGPNGYNGASYFQLIEMQARHIIRCLKQAKKLGADRVEVKPEANQKYFDAMKARTPNQVFFLNSCGSANSYYFDKHGDVPFRPASSVEAHWRSLTFPLRDYKFY